jgi:LacI family transcriptional regulator
MPRLKRATLTDVAKRAGVSVTTASYILNGRADEMRISSETDHRVKAAMKDLDYRPNWSARTLRRRTTQTIGLVSDKVATGAYASQLLTGASAGARSCGHLLVIGEAMGDPAVEDLLIKELTDRQVDGIIYATLAASRVSVPERLRKGRTVLLNCVDPDVDLPAVVPDDLGGGRAAVEHLLAAGLDGEVFVVGEDPTPDATAGQERLAGIVAALEEAGQSLAGVLPCPWGVGPAREAVGAGLADGARPKALICLNDRVAMGAYQALDAHGLSIPRDVSVISFDGSDLASWLQPRLTTLALPLRAMGELAAQTLMSTEWRAGGVTRLPLALELGESVRHGAARRRVAR